METSKERDFMFGRWVYLAQKLLPQLHQILRKLLDTINFETDRHTDCFIYVTDLQNGSSTHIWLTEFEEPCFGTQEIYIGEKKTGNFAMYFSVLVQFGKVDACDAFSQIRLHA